MLRSASVITVITEAGRKDPTNNVFCVRQGMYYTASLFPLKRSEKTRVEVTEDFTLTITTRSPFLYRVKEKKPFLQHIHVYLERIRLLSSTEMAGKYITKNAAPQVLNSVPAYSCHGYFTCRHSIAS